MTKPYIYLGAPEPAWIGRTTIPLFVSYGRLRRLKHKLPRSPKLGTWALDSRGFSELRQHGRWTITPEQYVADVLRYDTEIGNLSWAAQQDMMCEDEILAVTGLTELEHQRFTVANYSQLVRLWDQAVGFERENPFMLVLQGSDEPSYHRCWDMFEDAGVDVSNVPVIGVGSVCTRQSTGEIRDIMGSLRARDPELPIHAFGVKSDGLKLYGDLVDSIDSQAWSRAARYEHTRHPDCTAAHADCSYCLVQARQWWNDMVDRYGDQERYGTWWAPAV